MLAEKLAGSVGNASNPVYVEDVFSTYLYKGNNSVQGIDNGINLGSSYGGSGYFNGSSSYLTTPSNSAFTFGTGDFTIEFWMNPNSSNQTSTIFSAKGTDYYTDRPIVLQYNERVRLFLYSSGNVVTTDYLVTAGQWQHIAVTRSGSDVRIFYNGVLQQTTTNTTDIGSSTVTIGKSIDGNDWFYNGQISNLRVVKGTAVYTSNFTPSTAPLTAISGTSLLTCQTNGFVDASTNAFTITNNNAVAITNNGPFTGVNGKGGLVWIRNRQQAGYYHTLVDTIRGPSKQLYSNTSDAQYTATGLDVTAFTSSGFTLGPDSFCNQNTANHVSWTFRKQPKFFDVVTYTGNGSSTQVISHSLGSAAGCVIVKPTNTTGDWFVYHASIATGIGSSTGLKLNTTGYGEFQRIGNVTSTTFEVQSAINASGDTYVAYLYAHNAGGFGLTGTDNVISCGSFATDGASNATIDLGYEPQWVLTKRTDGTGAWGIYDTMRGWSYTAQNYLLPNSSGAEGTINGSNFHPTATGFTVSSPYDASATYIYIAIRRGAMKVPTDGTTVFGVSRSVETSGQILTSQSGVLADAIITKPRLPETYGPYALSRLTGNANGLVTSATNAESTFCPAYKFDNNLYAYISAGGLFNNAGGYGEGSAVYSFKRATGFFDEVCDTRAFTYGTLNHNLNAVPELIIKKDRSRNGTYWEVLPNTGPYNYQYTIYLNDTQAISGPSGSIYWYQAPTSTTFGVNYYFDGSSSGDNFVFYLFATCAGVSKVGSYTGTGATQTINCGFTGGARFVLIKRTDSTGDWYVWDSARGIVSGNDPYLLLNSTAAEVTSTDYIDTYSAGFEISSTAPASINASGGTFIFLAIA